MPNLLDGSWYQNASPRGYTRALITHHWASAQVLVVVVLVVIVSAAATGMTLGSLTLFILSPCK